MSDPMSVEPASVRSATPTPNLFRRVLVGMGGLAFWPVFIVLFGGAPACMGFEEPTLRTLEACPEVAAALGTPIERSWLGMSCGNAETSDSFGNASWSFPVSGPNGRGSVDVVAERRGGPWMLYTVMVETDAGNVDALACARGAGAAPLGAAMPGAPGIAAPVAFTERAFTATATTATPGAPVTAGASCEIRLGPGSGPYPCRAEIVCGGTTVYGGGTSGYLACTAAAGGLTAFDTDATPEGGDPMLTLTTSAGSAILSDTGPTGTWTVTFAFPPG